ncbi:hypothetical protein MBLNU457_4291t2 [Dothideomycetes sp. NU457]
MTMTMTEKARLASLRKSTPDSEALASSDDETFTQDHKDHNKQSAVANSLLSEKTPSQNPAPRRTSWLADIRSGPPRRSSTASITSAATLLAPGEQIIPLGRTISNSSTSPSNLNPISRTVTNENNGAGNNRSLPIPIPLQPTPKTYRSLSYSVGQMEEEASLSVDSGSTTTQERPKGFFPQSLLHRPQRPSYLGKLAEYTDGSAVSEEIGDIESPTESYASARSQGRPSESSVSPLVRQAAVGNIDVANSAYFGYPPSSSARNPAAMQTDRSFDHTTTTSSHGGLGSLAAMSSALQGLGALQGEAHRRGHWQTSLDFGALPDVPQSRRHSMAEIPTRRNSLVAAAANDSAMFSPSASADLVDDPFNTTARNPAAKRSQPQDEVGLNFAAGYFSGHGPVARSQHETAQASGDPNSPGGRYQNGPAHPVFTRPGVDTDKLVLVSFKCARTEIYYLVENTGLQIKEGDLVIVEADRGYDLGTVLRLGLNWEQARQGKDEANGVHLHWLTMFSQHNAANGAPAGSNAGMMANAAAHGANNLTTNPTSTTGNGSDPNAINAVNLAMQTVNVGHGRAVPNNLGNPAAQTSTQDIKPRMIRRLAQPHEVASLRDKEGNEAKAKRICQQKVHEHKLDMEVLDAEFQVDWKKLTFFYYANTYINFNVLVTDLFKIYKTRIWMSAVNPASLSTSLPPPTSFGPGAVEGRNSPLESRQAATQQWAQYQSSGSFGTQTIDNSGHASARALGSPRFASRVNASPLIAQPTFGQAQASGPHRGTAYGQFAPGPVDSSSRGALAALGGMARNPTVSPIARPGPGYQFPGSHF